MCLAGSSCIPEESWDRCYFALWYAVNPPFNHRWAFRCDARFVRGLVYLGDPQSMVQDKLRIKVAFSPRFDCMLLRSILLYSQ